MNAPDALDRYRGDGSAPAGQPPHRFPYRAAPDLARAVNIAIALRRPLLVKGAPGCGKTALARSIVHELGLNPATQFHRWFVKSTSRARDGLYTIDMVRRLQDAQLGREAAQQLAPYLHFGPLGKALSESGESVVLIDEIDKADIDFPNDLLHELDKSEFMIDELGADEAGENGTGLRKTYRSETVPIVIITSNDEKELPDAFLRRCVFCYIPFPDEAELIEIVAVNLLESGFDPKQIGQAQELFRRAAAHLLRIQGLDGQWRKTPATSELIDWVTILLRRSADAAELPGSEMLFKHQQDIELARKGALL